MSSHIGVIAEYALPDFIDREAMMMDGGQLYFQLTPADSGGDPTLIGAQLFNLDGSSAGTLKLIPAGINAGKLTITGPDGIPRLFTGGSFLTAFNEGVSLNASGEIITARDLPFPSASAGGSAPAFAGTSAGLAQQAEADLNFLKEQHKLALEQGNQEAATALANAIKLAEIELENQLVLQGKQQEFTAEQNALAQEAALKRERLNTLTDLIQSFVAAQAQARDTLANLQPDPFRFAAVAGGIAPFGTTPQQGFQQQLQQFAGAAVPSFDPSGSAASLEPVISQLTGAQAPQAPQTFGLAGGGTVPTPFNTMSARLVGEKGPEVMVTGPQGVTILPLGKGAQEGGFFPFEPIQFDKESLFPALQTSGIFGSLGINQLPITRRGEEQEIFGTGFPGTSTFNRLGIAPRLVRDVTTGVVFLIENGQHRRIETPADFDALGLRRSDIVNLSHEDVLALAPQRGLDVGFPIPTGGRAGLAAQVAQARQGRAPLQPTPTTQPSPFTKFSQPIIEPTTGVALPAPFMVASQMNKLRLTNPFAFNLLLSAYESAGVPGTAVLGSIQASLPFGAERTNIGLN